MEFSACVGITPFGFSARYPSVSGSPKDPLCAEPGRPHLCPDFGPGRFYEDEQKFEYYLNGLRSADIPEN